MFGLATSIDAVLAAVAARVVDFCEYDSTQVFLSLADEDDISKFPTKDLFVQIAPRNGVPRSGDVTGGGNELFTVDLSIAINLWVRLGLDVAYQDADQLRNATFGHLKEWLKVQAAVQQYYPEGQNGQASIFEEPARNTKFEFQPRRIKNGWSKLASWWTIPAVLNLDLD